MASRLVEGSATIRNHVEDLSIDNIAHTGLETPMISVNAPHLKTTYGFSHICVTNTVFLQSDRVGKEMATYAMEQGCDEQNHTESSEG